VADPLPGVCFVLPGEQLPGGGAAAVGNKAWNLMLMAGIGLNVPPAFVLPTAWYARGVAPDDPALRRVLSAGISRLEASTGLDFGSSRRPLLVAVRSGAAVSMPGMLETVLNVGLTPASLDGLIRLTGNPRLAWDSYRRLVQNYGEVVAGLPIEPLPAGWPTRLLRASVSSTFARCVRSPRPCSSDMRGWPVPRFRPTR